MTKTFSFFRKGHTFLYLLMILFLLCSSLVSWAEEVDPVESFYLETGLKMIDQLDEILRYDGYLAMYTSMDSIQLEAENLREKNTNLPQSAVLLTFEVSEVLDRLSLMEGMATIQDIPDSLKSLIATRLVSAIPNIINGQTQSSTVLALSSILSTGEAYPAPAAQIPSALLWYEMEEGLSVLVSFIQNTQGIVLVSAGYVLGLDFDLEALMQDQPQVLLLLPPSLQIQRFGAQDLLVGK